MICSQCSHFFWRNFFAKKIKNQNSKNQVGTKCQKWEQFWVKWEQGGNSFFACPIAILANNNNNIIIYIYYIELICSQCSQCFRGLRIGEFVKMG